MEVNTLLTQRDTHTHRQMSATRSVRLLQVRKFTTVFLVVRSLHGCCWDDAGARAHMCGWVGAQTTLALRVFQPLVAAQGPLRCFSSQAETRRGLAFREYAPSLHVPI